MKQIPFQLHDICRQSELFGRDSLLDNLIKDVRLQQNVNIIGSRRFGKTCLCKTAITLIKQQSDELKTYPVFFDFKSADISGTCASYAYMIGVFVANLYNDDIFTSKEKFGTVEIVPSGDWIEIYDQLEQFSSPRLQSLLEKIVKWFSELLDQMILFVIDEYEYLFKYALDNPSSFGKLRKLSSDISESTESRFFCFWLVGAEPWDKFCTNVPGSGDGNTISSTEFVPPIDRESFAKMWDYECLKIEDVDLKGFMMKQCVFAFEKSGGVPFYGKDVIGAYLFKHQSLPDFSVCSPFYKELLTKMMQTGEYKILKMVSLLPQKIEQSNNRISLISKGIVNVDSKDKLSVNGEFLKDFIVAEMNDSKSSKPQKNDLEVLVKNSMSLIETINNQMKNKGKDLVFKLVNDSSSLEEDLRVPCYNIDQFSDFSLALYNTYFERTKEGRKEGNLHFEFFIKSEFAKCADISRHSFGHAHEMDCFLPKDGQYSKADMLQRITGSVNEPYLPNDWYSLQLGLLKMFENELKRMFEYIKRHI